MQSQPQEQSHRPRVDDEFKQNLRKEWTRPVACQNKCSPEEACSCQRQIVHVKALVKWWNEPLNESPDQTRGHRFLDEMDLAPHQTFPPAYKDIFTGEQCSIRVLSLLLQQGRDSLIDLFHYGAMYDNYLMRGDSQQILRDTLLKKMSRKEVDTIVGDFHRDKWAYCPMELTLGMNFNAHGTKVIPPFCSKIKLPDKGGTASIYWVAVQKDLISDHALANTLRESLYHDDDYGECYQMILKSYAGNKESVFELERQAFAGLNSKKDVPILQYLGSYTHDYGEGKEMGKTYNILLEYGDNDLYQAWADETNVPPVRAEEILRTWNSLFEIARAIRHVHHLEVPRGGGSEPRRFHGWHADIKPDNILSIRGRLKLSDFGFSSFAPVIKTHNPSAPTEFIRGFTDTYGAPEVFQMRRADGTLSGVTQSIDIWSFGCVLSVAATWIVLGFQGIRQYEQLRQLAPSNYQDGKIYDRFHNGTRALDEIRKWHDYLRGHLRPSDTTTKQVLTLIENDLLLENPSQRPDSEKLCKELQTLHKRAQREIQDLPQHLRETDAVVLRALSKIEDRAHNQRASEARMNPALLLKPMIPTGASQVNPRQWASMQVQKDSMINNKPLGQTPYRQEILKQELKESTPCLGRNDEPAIQNAHNGEFTQTPAHSTPVQEFPIFSPPSIPMKPQFRKTDQQERDMHHHAADNEVLRQITTPKTPPPHQYHSKIQDDDKRDRVVSFNPYSMPNLRRPGYAVDSAPDVTFEGPPPKEPLRKIITHPVPSSLPYTPGTKHSGYSIPREQSPLEMRDQENGNVQSEIPELAVHSSEHSTSRSNEVYSPASPTGFYSDLTSTPNPKPLLEPFSSPTYQKDMEIGYVGAHFELEHAAEVQGSATLHGSSHIVQELPPSVLDLPYSICQKRKKLDQGKPGVIEKLVTRAFRREKDRIVDPKLKEMSSDGRELFFIIDNGWTMSEHWPILTFVIETLAMNAAGIDKSGIDLRFTVDGNAHNENDVAGDNGRALLRKRLEDAWPENMQTGNVKTDMVTVFQEVYEEWEQKGKPATTLYVFTDGKWASENLTALDEKIRNFAGEDLRGSGDRHFSIQFIRFGDDETDKEHLRWLDDKLCASLNLRDIIDHCSWRADVDKIFKGSIKSAQDKKDDKESAIPYDYKELVEKFDKFNRGEESQENGVKSPRFLSPTSPSPPQRSPSQLSGRSSEYRPKKRDSVHPETPRWHPKRLSGSSFLPR